MKLLGLISKLDIWVPHVLTERNLLRRIITTVICLSSVKENNPCENEALYNWRRKVDCLQECKTQEIMVENIIYETAQTTSKVDSHQK